MKEKSHTTPREEKSKNTIKSRIYIQRDAQTANVLLPTTAAATSDLWISLLSVCGRSYTARVPKLRYDGGKEKEKEKKKVKKGSKVV